MDGEERISTVGCRVEAGGWHCTMGYHGGHGGCCWEKISRHQAESAIPLRLLLLCKIVKQWWQGRWDVGGRAGVKFPAVGGGCVFLG